MHDVPLPCYNRVRMIANNMFSRLTWKLRTIPLSHLTAKCCVLHLLQFGCVVSHNVFGSHAALEVRRKKVLNGMPL